MNSNSNKVILTDIRVTKSWPDCKETLKKINKLGQIGDISKEGYKSLYEEYRIQAGADESTYIDQRAKPLQPMDGITGFTNLGAGRSWITAKIPKF